MGKGLKGRAYHHAGEIQGYPCKARFSPLFGLFPNTPGSDLCNYQEMSRRPGRSTPPVVPDLAFGSSGTTTSARFFAMIGPTLRFIRDDEVGTVFRNDWTHQPPGALAVRGAIVRASYMDSSEKSKLRASCGSCRK